MKCAYKLSDGPCNQSIVRDIYSYSGWSHERKADWLHFATPKVDVGYTVFKPCDICGKLGPDNEQHILFDGHVFRTSGF